MLPSGSSLVCRFHMENLWLFQSIYFSMYFESDIKDTGGETDADLGKANSKTWIQNMAQLAPQAVQGWFNHEPSKPVNESWFKGAAANEAAEFVDSSAENQAEVDSIPRSSTREERRTTLDSMNERFDESWTMNIIMRHALEYVYCDATGFAASVPHWM